MVPILQGVLGMATVYIHRFGDVPRHHATVEVKEPGDLTRLLLQVAMRHDGSDRASVSFK